MMQRDARMGLRELPRVANTIQEKVRSLGHRLVELENFVQGLQGELAFLAQVVKENEKRLEPVEKVVLRDEKRRKIRANAKRRAGSRKRDAEAAGKPEGPATED